MIEDLPKKLFWRRAGAHLIDWTLLGILFGLLTVVLQPVVPAKLSAPGLFNLRQCSANLPDGMVIDTDAILPLEEGERRTLKYCEISHMGLTSHKTVRIGTERKSGVTTFSRSVVFPVDKTGKAIRLIPVSYLMLLFGPLLLAATYGVSGQSPGKRAVGVCVEDGDGRPANGTRAVKREVLKWFPIMLAALASLYFTLTYDPGEFVKTAGAELTGPFSFWLLILGLLLALVVWLYWFFPFLRWRGQSFYDKWLGLCVVRKTHGPSHDHWKG